MKGSKQHKHYLQMRSETADEHIHISIKRAH